MLDISFIKNNRLSFYEFFKSPNALIENFNVPAGDDSHNISIKYYDNGKCDITHTIRSLNDTHDDIERNYNGSNIRMWFESRRFVIEWDTYEDSYFGFEVRW